MFADDTSLTAAGVTLDEVEKRGKQRPEELLKLSNMF
jgi:hypothetical protein